MAAQKAHYHNGYQILAVCIYYISEELQATIELKKYLLSVELTIDVTDRPTFSLPQSEINAGPSDGTELLQTENRLGHVFCFLLLKIATLII